MTVTIHAIRVDVNQYGVGCYDSVVIEAGTRNKLHTATPFETYAQAKHNAWVWARKNGHEIKL